MALVQLRTFTGTMEAAIVRTRLEAEGITAFVFDAQEEWSTTDLLAPIRVMVLEEEYDEAFALLEEIDCGRGK